MTAAAGAGRAWLSGEPLLGLPGSFPPSSPHLSPPLSSPLSLSPSPLPPPSASHSAGSEGHPLCWCLSPEPGVESGGQDAHPKVPSAAKYLRCVYTQKLLHRFCQPIPTARVATMAGPTMPPGRLVAHTKHPPGHYDSGAEIHPCEHLIGHSAALNDLSVPCPAIFCLINSFIVHRIKQDKGLPAIMIH